MMAQEKQQMRRQALAQMQHPITTFFQQQRLHLQQMVSSIKMKQQIPMSNMQQDQILELILQ